MSDEPRRITAHAEVRRVAHDTATYSHAPSRHLQIPHGLDGAEHAAARRVLEPFFAPAALDALEPQLAEIAASLVDEYLDGVFDAVGDLGCRYAARAQSAWLGWDGDVEARLRRWMPEHRDAARRADPDAHAAVAASFDAIIRDVIADRRAAHGCDLTSLLMAVHWDGGRRITDDEVVSVLRNWTGGDLVSIALCAGVVLHAVASRPGAADDLRGASDAVLDAAIDEMLRLDDPFVSNRRVAIRPDVVGGCPVHTGDVVVLDWRAANRDPAVFADRFDPVGHAAANLVYGTGPHACPGRSLATRELRHLLRAVLAAGRPELAAPGEREEPPLAGWRTLPVRVR